MTMKIGNDDPNDQNPQDPAAQAIDDSKKLDDSVGFAPPEAKDFSTRIQAATDKLNASVDDGGSMTPGAASIIDRATDRVAANRVAGLAPTADHDIDPQAAKAAAEAARVRSTIVRHGHKGAPSPRYRENN